MTCYNKVYQIKAEQSKKRKEKSDMRIGSKTYTTGTNMIMTESMRDMMCMCRMEWFRVRKDI